MNFNEHSALAGKHAFLGASQHAWLNYDEEKLVTVCNNLLAKERGTRLHALAAELISLRQTLPKTKAHLTLNDYVNDAIGFGLKPEVILYYSDNAFGTADAIDFKRNTLRIHDLKTGADQVVIEKKGEPIRLKQLEIYAALFCLEYNKNPEEIMIVLRIYQNNRVWEEIPEPKIVREIMAKIVMFDKRINELKEGV